MIDTRRLNNKSGEMNKKPFFVITNWLFIIMKYEKYSNFLREGSHWALVNSTWQIETYFLFVVKFGVNGSEASEVMLFSWASKAPDLGLSAEIQDTLIKIIGRNQV